MNNSEILPKLERFQVKGPTNNKTHFLYSMTIMLGVNDDPGHEFNICRANLGQLVYCVTNPKLTTCVLESCLLTYI